MQEVVAALSHHGGEDARRSLGELREHLHALVVVLRIGVEAQHLVQRFHLVGAAGEADEQLLVRVGHHVQLPHVLVGLGDLIHGVVPPLAADESAGDEAEGGHAVVDGVELLAGGDAPTAGGVLEVAGEAEQIVRSLGLVDLLEDDVHLLVGDADVVERVVIAVDARVLRHEPAVRLDGLGVLAVVHMVIAGFAEALGDIVRVLAREVILGRSAGVVADGLGLLLALDDRVHLAHGAGHERAAGHAVDEVLVGTQGGPVLLHRAQARGNAELGVVSQIRERVAAKHELVGVDGSRVVATLGVLLAELQGGIGAVIAVRIAARERVQSRDGPLFVLELLEALRQ